MAKRPWSLVKTVLQRLPVGKWDFIGTVSFEDRCLAAFNSCQTNISDSRLILRIDDPENQFSERANEKTDVRQKEFEGLGISAGEIYRFGLLDPIGKIVNRVKNFLSHGGENLIIDMSCMPKRALFLTLRFALESKNVQNLVVTYSIPAKYTDQPLAEDPQPMSTFPGLSKDSTDKDEPKVIIVGLGYLPFDLSALKQELSGKVPVQVLFPFPPGAPSYQRNWKLLLSLFGEDEPQNIPEPIRVDARDVSYAYDVLQELTQKGEMKAYMLPFGPKPHSLAMALHCIKSRSEMLYTQPRIYNPDYSEGTRIVNGMQEVYGYCIRIAGKDLY